MEKLEQCTKRIIEKLRKDANQGGKSLFGPDEEILEAIIEEEYKKEQSKK